MTIYEEDYDVEIGKMPNLNQKNVKRAVLISYNDLPDKEFICHIFKMVNSLMKAIILFMTRVVVLKKKP